MNERPVIMASEDREQTRLVTISASYGAGGSVVAPALARRLDVPFLQRATTSAGGIALRVLCAERLEPEEGHITPVHRLLASFTQAMPTGPTQSPLPARHHDAGLRRICEEGIRRLAATGEGVILGRGAAVVLGKDHGLHVRLDGPAGPRVAQGAEIEGISLERARHHMNAADRARNAHVRRLYRADPADPGLYHLVIDSTAMPLDAVTEIILRALSAHAASARPPVSAKAPGLAGER
jgi:cytidylate kinase